MKFGIRKFSLKRRFAARTSLKRMVRHRMGLKAPRGFGIFTNPKRALYNRVYNRTSVSVDRLFKKHNTSSTQPSVPAFNIGYSFWTDLAIFVILTAVFFPFAILFLLYKLYVNKKKHQVTHVETDTLAITKNSNPQNGILGQFDIPEPTRSLLWITDEDTSKISSPQTIKITIDPGNASAEINDGHNFYGEPSLIWTRLPVEPNNELETQPMYYPSYAGLSPKHRYQYLSWLKDITQKTNLSYVFLYYYGLERHMLVGNYDLAVDEVLRLLRHHDQGSFKLYVTSALIAASSYRKRTDIIKKAPVLLQETSNESLILRNLARVPLSAHDIMALSSRVGFTNKRYMKRDPELFATELQKYVNDYEKINGSILSNVDIDRLPKQQSVLFGNTSLPRNIRSTEIPDLIHDKTLNEVLNSLLSKTHERMKTMSTAQKRSTQM